MKRSGARNSKGQSTMEFGATTVVLICLILIPLLTIAFVPIRYALCQGVVSDFVSRLAHSETRSSAYDTLRNDLKWRQLLAACGAQVTDAKLELVATANSGNKQILVQRRESIPKEWLPDGSLAPCIYSLHLDCKCAISPLFGGTGSITGINAPINLIVSGSAHWENLSRDPQSSTLAFYIDE